MAFLKDIIEKPITGEWGTDGDTVSVLRTSNFTNTGILDLSKVIKRNISEKKIAQKKLLKGDVIIEKSGGSPKQPVGRVVFFNEEGVYLCNNFTSILRPKKEKVNPKYLHYLLFANHRFGVTGMFQNKTTGIINLQLPRYVDKLKIPLPPLETQKHIAQILDDAAALRDKTQQLLDEYDQLAQSIFLDMFGDPVVNPNDYDTKIMKDICKKVTDGTHDTPERLTEGIKFITGKHIRPYKIDFDNCDYVTEEVHEIIYKRCNPEKNDVLYTNIGVNLGTAALNRVDYEFSMKNVALLKPKEDFIKGRYLEYFLNSNKMKQKIIWISSIGGAQKFLSLTQLRKLKIVVPPIEFQNQFAEKIALIEQQKALAKQELQESEDLFNCLLQKAFKGELV